MELQRIESRFAMLILTFNQFGKPLSTPKGALGLHSTACYSNLRLQQLKPTGFLHFVNSCRLPFWSHLKCVKTVAWTSSSAAVSIKRIQISKDDLNHQVLPAAVSHVIEASNMSLIFKSEDSVYTLDFYIQILSVLERKRSVLAASSERLQINQWVRQRTKRVQKIHCELNT